MTGVSRRLMLKGAASLLVADDAAETGAANAFRQHEQVT
jgi:hypothetical protein